MGTMNVVGNRGDVMVWAGNKEWTIFRHINLSTSGLVDYIISQDNHGGEKARESG